MDLDPLNRKSLYCNTAAIGGLFILGVGVWLWYPPAALFVVGGLVCALGVWGTLR